MVTLDDLKGIVLLSHLTEEMKEKLLPHMELRKYKQDEFVFREGEPAANFFFLRSGKVVLEKRLSDKMTVTFGSVKPGYSFGWSAMLRQPYTTEAICAELSEILVLDADKTHETMEADNALGFIFSQRLLRVIKRRLEVRTEQFVKAIANNPECMVLLE
ncbi:MAG: cyclic nucleotide-binding domain-containing protein [Thermodesulfobacteriota bacterium]